LGASGAGVGMAVSDMLDEILGVSRRRLGRIKKPTGEVWAAVTLRVL
jgi:hypothetical protein